ncbi:hypothetical protein CDD81_5593 [Ophiocordyceps australis]|uniref:RING-type domain-containing protein n=1 Tax=Ophiocordyceps australis TaxID=1399860 RepID=A0A2C5YA16_9HYPO|nr:hypothetical protein CDD81_5593 [Ophiocordyceps australis]
MGDQAPHSQPRQRTVTPLSREEMASLLKEGQARLTLSDPLSCVICYNDFGVESPEGINEVPFRLPRCKHVFGDHCIKRWFEDSDSCPYCRDKVRPEPKHYQTSSRAFMNFMRLRGAALPSALSAELYSRFLEITGNEGDLINALSRRDRINAAHDSAEAAEVRVDHTKQRPTRIDPSPLLNTRRCQCRTYMNIRFRK